MIRRRFQFSIATLLIATLVCAVFVRFWPWRLATATHYLLAVWAAFTLIQVPLLTWVWAGAPTDREKWRMACYSIALPCCVLPIANWLLLMSFIIAEQNKVSMVPVESVMGPLAILLSIFTVASIVVLPFTFVLFVGMRRDPAFWALRLLAFGNLVGSVSVAVVGAR